MKPFYFLLASVFISSSLFAQLEQLILEEQVYSWCGDPNIEPPIEGLKTYHLYAELSSDQYEFSSIETSEGCSPVVIQSSTGFFNSPAGTALDLPNFAVFCSFIPDISYDSFISFGTSTGASPFVSSIFSYPVDLNASLGVNPGSEPFGFTDGSIFVLPEEGQGVPDENLRVFLGQFSTTGMIEYQINVGIYDSANEVIHYYYNEACDDVYPPGTPIYVDGVDGNFNLSGSSSNCTDPEACNYNQNLNPEFDDPSTCDYTTCVGCTDENACDYNEFATVDDGSCNTACEGCTDPSYTNYDPNASIDDGSCVNIGCDYPLASNYNPDVTEADGSCIILGCTDPTICNYNPLANEDDGSCDSINCPGCTDNTAVNYNPQAITENGSCHSGPLVNLVVESSNPGNIEGAPNATITRVFAQLSHPDARVEKVYAPSSCAPLSISSGEMFINNWNAPNNFFQIFPNTTPQEDLPTDTWLTIGDPTMTGLPSLFLIGSFYPYYALSFGAENACETTDGGWAMFGESQSLDAQNRVLLGQFITEGSLGYELNVSVIDENGVTHNYLHAPCIDGNSVYAPNANLVYQENYCADPSACNYEGLQNPNFIDNSTCEFESCYKEVNGFVFVDINANGVKDPGEIGIPNVDVQISNPELIVQTDGQGFYDFGSLQIEGTRIITTTSNENYPHLTTPLIVQITETNADDMSKDFGMHNETPEYSLELEDFMLLAINPDIEITCNGSMNLYQVEVHNTGNLLQNGVLEIAFDDNFLGDPIFLSGGGFMGDDFLSFNISNLFPGDERTYYFGIGGPGVDNIGEDLTVDASANVLVDGDLVFSTTSSTTDQVTCAYDPNDKQVFPQGYGEPHYILEGTELNYLIRFQNTGNAPAIDVNVADTMSIALDLSSIEITETSHDMELIVDENSREVIFSFPNIFLPDSTANEEESHGFIAYKIKAREDLQPETRIENTAHIFFDNNPAIVTNTTWNTIFNCATKSELNLPTSLCENESLEIFMNDPFAESYEWNIWPEGNLDVMDESGAMVEWMAPGEGEYSVQMTANNPLCSTSYDQNLLVLPAPSAAFDISDNLLSVSNPQANESYQWYLNGEVIPNETAASLMVQESGNYSLEVMDENACSDISDESFVLFIGVDEYLATFKAYPNPCDQHLELFFNEAGSWNLRVIDLLGKTVESKTIEGSSYVLETGALSNGSYTLVLEKDAQVQHLKFMVQH